MAHESLSALLDGECSAEELDRLLDELEHKPELKRSWSRLVQARDAREGVRLAAELPCICAGVMARLDAQPEPLGANVVELSPRRQPTVVVPPAAVPVAAPTPAAAFAATTPAARFNWQPLTGWAVAASIAVVALVLNFSGTQDVQRELNPGVAAMPQVTAPVSNSNTVRRPRYLQTVAATPEDLQAADDDLRNYLIEHSNSLADRGMGGALSYARFAAHTAEFVPQPVSGGTGEQP
jgi:negative regulator of sigma E activity